MPRGGKTKFQPGQSGNPNGRPPGRPDRRTNLLLSIIGDEGRDAMLKRCVELANKGHPVALRMVMERLSPPRRPTHEPVDLPDGFHKMTPCEQIDAINEKVANGTVAPDVGQILLSMAEVRMKAIEHEELAKRLEAVEVLVGAINEAANG